MWVPQEVNEVETGAVAEEAGPANSTGGPPRPGRKRRRGVTSMEYVVMASFILMVLIGTVQYLGYGVGNLFTSDSNSTGQAQSTALNGAAK